MVLTSNGKEEIDVLTQKIMNEIESKSSKDLAGSDEIIKILNLTNMRNAKALFQHVNEAPTDAERNVGKKALAEALLQSVWHQRLYFIVRSVIMGILGASLTLVYLLIFHSINIILEIPLGIFSFIFILAVSRPFDVQIVKATRIIVDFLACNQRLMDFVLSQF